MSGYRARLALIAAAVACLLSPVLPARASAARPAVAGTTTVTASRSGSVAVRLPKPVTMAVFEDVRLTAPRGRLAAVVVKKDGAWDAPLAQIVRTGYCGEPGCVSPLPNAAVGSIWAPGSTDGLRGTLPPGNYTIYLVTDGAPATATIRFRGLSGTVRLAARGPVRASVVAAKPTMAEPASSPSLFAGGTAYRSGRRGALNATMIWKELPAYVQVNAVGICQYDTAAAGSGALPSYQLPCGNGRGAIPPSLGSTNPAGPATTPLGPGRFVSGIKAGYTIPPDDDIAIGGYHNNTGLVTAAYVHQLWLDF
jgi:hypothetical protein